MKWKAAIAVTMLVCSGCATDGALRSRFVDAVNGYDTGDKFKQFESIVETRNDMYAKFEREVNGADHW